MVRYGELEDALSVYVRSGTHDEIPTEYYRHVIKAAIKANNEGKQWDVYQAAAVLLYFVFNDGILNPSQLTAGGLRALDHAEAFLQEINTNADVVNIDFVANKNQRSA